jgi:hypothetical protein
MQTNRYRNLLWAPLLALALLASACAGIVVEPADETTVPATATFWGYAPSAGQNLQLEALNSSNQWEVVATMTSGSTPAHVGYHTGYKFSVSYNVRNSPTRFWRTSPWGSTHARIHFRVQTPNLGLARSRKFDPTANPQGIESNLERAWLQHESGDGLIRVDFQK